MGQIYDQKGFDTMSYCKKEKQIIMKPKKAKQINGILPKRRKPSCCPTGSENVNQIENNPVNTNTFNPTINVSPIIHLPPTPVNGEQGLLTEFNVDQPFTMYLTANIDITTFPTEIALVRMAIDNKTDRVWFNGTVGLVLNDLGLNPLPPSILFTITRKRPGGTEEDIFTTVDRPKFVGDTNTTSFAFVDEAPILTQGQQLVEYRLKINQIPGPFSSTTVIGPVIFTGAKIGANP